MNVSILDDYQNVVSTLACFRKLAGHKVTVWNDHTKDIDVLAERLKDTEALVLIRGRTLGIFGYGRIGAVVAGYGKAFGMKVLVWGRETTLVKVRADGYKGAASKQVFFAECDVISLHMRLVDGTRGIVSADDLGRMK